MDPIKIVVFVVAFLLLLLLGRKLSSFSESTIVTPPPEPGTDEAGLVIAQRGTGKEPAVVGADLPFPINVPEIIRDADGRYSRPEFLNYYFEQTDLVHGPENATCFFDDFYLLVRDIENNHTALYKYFVATPAGLQKAMDERHLPALYLEEQSLIVPRWNVPLILDAVVRDVMKSYAEKNQDQDSRAIPVDDETVETD